jgi:outer membrane lipoprotein-sorting protein
MYTTKNENIAMNYDINSDHRMRSNRIISLLSVIIILLASVCSAGVSSISDKLVAKSIIKGAGGNSKLPAPSAKRLMELAKTDHIKMLEWSMALYDQNVKDYSAVLHKQERIGGKLIKPQQIAFWFKEKPYSLLMKWEKNAVSIDKLLYVEGQENGNMYVHPTAPFAWIKSVKRKPRCKEALKGSLKTADEFGFYRNMQYLHKVLTKAQNSKSVQMRLLGTSNVYGRDTIAMEASFTGSDCQYKKIIMHFGTENILPLALAFYDRSGGLYSSYAFSNLKINTGMTEDLFCKNKNKM